MISILTILIIVFSLLSVSLNISALERSSSLPTVSTTDSDSFFTSPPVPNRRSLKEEMFAPPKRTVFAKPPAQQSVEINASSTLCPLCPDCAPRCPNRSENTSDRLSRMYLEHMINSILHTVESAPSPSSGHLFVEMRPASSGFNALREFSQMAKNAPDTLNQAAFSKLGEAFDSIFRNRLTAQAIIESHSGSCRVDAHANVFADFVQALSGYFILNSTLILRCFVVLFQLLSVCSCGWISFEFLLCLCRRRQSLRRVTKALLLLTFSFGLLVLSDSVLSNYTYLLAKEAATQLASKQLPAPNACVPEAGGWFTRLLPFWYENIH